MQRLSKAVENTAKDAQNVAADVAAVAANVTATLPATDAMNTVDTVAVVDEVAATAVTPGGHEETKSSDGEGAAADMSAPEDTTASADAASTSVSSTPAPTAKWHRELCSLAEMGFEDTARNISLLEKHVTSSGMGGMER